MLPINYNDLKLNTSEKTDEGFDEPILSNIQALLTESLASQNQPRLAHFIIQSPNDLLFKRLGIEITRWYSQRKPNSDKKPLWIAVYEYSKTKGYHLHLAVIADGISYIDLQILSERLLKYSKKGYAKLQRRKRAYMTDADGVIMRNKDDAFIRIGHSHLHNVKSELSDAYERVSYFAKSMTKRLIPDRKKSFLVCRFNAVLTAQRPEL